MPISLFDWQKKAFLDSTAKYNIIPAGRRTGKTQGAVNASIVNTAQGDKCLWVDTINSNIDRYVERYYIPALKANQLEYDYHAQKKLLKIETGYIDMRSSDKPENIEGFGYNKIYLNEAGIILNNDSLYINSILPMMLDYDDSQLYAFGTPKGKINKHGEDHRFWSLWQNVLNKVPNYSGIQLSSYDNPLLTPDTIKELEAEILKIDPDAVPQEIGGQFLDSSGDKLFNFTEMQFFKMAELNQSNLVDMLGAIDVADEGEDSYSFPVGAKIGRKIYITDWLFSKENTNYTIPRTTQLIRNNRMKYVVMETNNQGSVVLKTVQNEISGGTNFIPKYNSSKKHSRIVLNSSFIKENFVFRSDYEPGSEYDKAMRELFGYTKDAKSKHDDSPDSLALFAEMVSKLFTSEYW